MTERITTPSPETSIIPPTISIPPTPQPPSITTSIPRPPSPGVTHLQRRPPTLKESLCKTALLFPPLNPPAADLLPYLPSAIILPAKVTSTTLAHTTNLHVRSNTLLLCDTTSGAYQAVLRLPPQSISTNKGVVTISSIGCSPLHIHPSEGSIGPLLDALRPSVPPLITILNRLSNRVFTARLKYRKVALKLFPLDNVPCHAIATRAGLQRARGVGIVPMIAAIQGRGYCGIVMPIFADLGTYVDRLGKVGIVNGRGVVAQLVHGVCRVHELGCEVGEFDKSDVLVHTNGAMLGRIGHANVLHGGQDDTGEWKDTLASLLTIVRECCDVDTGGEDFIRGCERSWSAHEMKSHAWVREAVTPQLRKIRVKGSKDILDVPGRIGTGDKGILGWEFVCR